MSDHDTDRWARWGPLADRYSAEQPRKMLALDGGGMRGIIALGVLERMESLLAERLGRGEDFALCEFFDYFSGTSTGAIIAAALAQGMRVGDVLDFYKQFGEGAFTKAPIWKRMKSMYDSGPLEKLLQEVFGKDTNLMPEHLKSLLLVVTRNASTDSAWPISSNPDALYNDPGHPQCNLKVPLWQLVRASTAAPVAFRPEIIQWDPDDDSKSWAFDDGGTTPYLNPAFLMYRMATEPAYRLGWPRGEDKLLLVSVGTGSQPEDTSVAGNIVSAGADWLTGLGRQVKLDQDISCRTAGRCTFGPWLDREMMDLVPRNDAGQPLPLEDSGKAFLYARYDFEISEEGLDKIGLRHIKAEDVSSFTSTDHIEEMERIGQRLGDYVDLAHFGSFVPAGSPVGAK